MPKTPSQRTTRSSSIPSVIQEPPKSTKTSPTSLEDIGHLINSAKDEILSKLMNEITQVNECISSLTSKVVNIENGLAKMKETIEKHEEEFAEIRYTVSNLKENLFSQVTEEVEQRSNRMQNLVISGVTELGSGTIDERKEHDLNELIKVLDEMEINYDKDDFRVSRIGKPFKDKPRLLKVVCPDSQMKQDILRKSKMLRTSSSFKGVYVNQDLTPIQQCEFKRLRMKLKELRDKGEDVIIFRNKIVKRDNTKDFRQGF